MKFTALNQKLEAHKCILTLCKLYLNSSLLPSYFTGTISDLLWKHVVIVERDHARWFCRQSRTINKHSKGQCLWLRYSVCQGKFKVYCPLINYYWQDQNFFFLPRVQITPGFPRPCSHLVPSDLFSECQGSKNVKRTLHSHMVTRLRMH
jgi:hypothetical protein